MYRIHTLLAAAAIAGCGGGGGGSSTTGAVSVHPQIAALEESGAIPRLDRSASLAGPDSNANGVRDDLDAYITANYTEPAQRAAVTQFARSIQAAVLVDVTSRPALADVVLRIARATHCVYTRFPEGGPKPTAIVGDQIEAMTVSTKARIKAYMRFNRSVDGSSWVSPEGDTCE